MIPCAWRDTRGFSLLAVLVVLSLLAIALGVMMVFADRVLQAQRMDVVEEEMQAIYRGIVGDQTETFGFLGDVGDYPVSLADLVVNPGSAGWKGPYVQDARMSDGTLRDPWGQPYEVFIVNSAAGSDQLAIISRGPDGLSTNTAANPNVAASFTGAAPTAANYFSDPKNVDNRVFPLPSAAHADALNVNTTATLSVNVNNFDSNTLVNAFVPACPSLFTITVTGSNRGTDDVPATPYAPGFSVLLPQGPYRVVIRSAILPTPPVNDGTVIYPAVPISRTYNITGLDSSGTDAFVLTVTNSFPAQDLDVWAFATKLGTVNRGQSLTFTPKGCSAMKIYKKGSTDPADLIDQFTMPHANYTAIEGATAATLTVQNTQKDPVNVYNEGVLIGSVGGGKSKTFTTGLFAGNTITIKNQKTGALLATFVLNVGSNSRTV